MTARGAYEARRKGSEEKAVRLDGYSAWLGHGRSVLVVVLLVCFAVTGRAGFVRGWWAYAAAAVVFTVTWFVQGAIDARVRRARLRAAHYARSLDRLDGKWRSFASTGASLAAADHPYARDLDLVGAGSLFQLLDTTRTKQGERTLAAWLLSPGELEELRARAATVRAITNDVDDRERLATTGDDAAIRVDEDPIVAWAEGTSGFDPTTPLRIAAFALPVALLVTFTLHQLDLLTGWLPALLALVNLGLLRALRRRLASTAALAQHAESELGRLLPIIEGSRGLPRPTPRLERLHHALAGAQASIRGLRRRVTFLQSRANLIVAFIGPLLLWDLHGALLLEDWRRREGKKLRGWFAALGELEALHALATYAFEHAGDTWPELVDGPLVLEAEQLGHALLSAEACVCNDVRLAGPGRALLVTGSNMSGKSTLLRSVGLASVMALAGLPVRARKLRLSRVQVATCMRVSDSLQEGASFFLAEVRRLKVVVELAREATPVLFLLDEILQGTNTRERSLGARGVVANLVRLGASGLVSTHDLSLVQLGDVLQERLEFAHFTDRAEGESMAFDYVMRPGVVQGSNALRVMRANGLDVDVPEDTKAV